MAKDSVNDALAAWKDFESFYRTVRFGIDSFVATATVVGLNIIQDVPTRIEYMKMIRAEADDMLAAARKNKTQARQIFDRISKRRNELRLISQDKAKASTAILSKLITKNRTKYQLLVNAANSLAKEGKIPSIGMGKNLKSIPLEQLSQDQLDDVLLKAIDKAGGSRKSITPTNMKLRGAGLLLLSVALAGVDIYLAQDKSFAVTKNVSTLAGGAGTAWAFAAGGLAVGGPVGGLIGLIVGGVVGSYVAEEAHFHIRGLNAQPEVDLLIKQYHGFINFDEAGLGRALHVKFVANFESIIIAFSHLNEKRNSDADDVARTYIEIAQMVSQNYPKGALVDGFRSRQGKALAELLYSIHDAGWTSNLEQSQMAWLKQIQR